MTPWRSCLYRELGLIDLAGQVADLGGGKEADYHRLFKGNPVFTSFNLNDRADLEADLEKPFPAASISYDAAVALNILEHIFNYQQFLREAHRILKPGGTLVLAVPFMVQIHPSPRDYWRFSGEALTKMLEEAGFKQSVVKPLGTGVFLASSQILYNVNKFSLLQWLNAFFGSMLDQVLRLLSTNYREQTYPLGFLVIAQA